MLSLHIVTLLFIVHRSHVPTVDTYYQYIRHPNTNSLHIVARGGPSWEHMNAELGMKPV